MKLGITNLLDKIQQINSGCVYYLGAQDKDTAVNFALNCLARNSNESALRYLVLDGVRTDDILQTQVSDAILNSVKAHVYECKNTDIFLDSLPSDLIKYKATDEHSFFVVLFDDRALAKTSLKACLSNLKNISHFAKNYNVSLLLLGYGDNSASLSNRLLKEDRSLSGLGAISKTPNMQKLDILYWRALDGTFSQGNYEIALTEEGFTIPKSTEEEFASTDTNTCYVCESVFTPDSNHFSEIKKFSSQSDLIAEAMEKASAATIFLAIEKREAIDDTAKQIYELRTRKGNALKILVIEKIPGIRANSEHFLLSCGANYIFTAGSHNSYINTMMPTLRAISYSKRISMSFEKMLDNYQVLDREGNGFLMPEAFFSKVEFLLSKKVDEAAVDGTLITLRPKLGLLAEQCLSQFKPKRAGDYGTLIGNVIIIYLPSCRNGELAISLEHTFNTDPTTLFDSCDAVYSRSEILSRVDLLKDEPYHDFNSNAAMQQIIESTKQRLASRQKARSMSELAVMVKESPEPFEISTLLPLEEDSIAKNPYINKKINKKLLSGDHNAV